MYPVWQLEIFGLVFTFMVALNPVSNSVVFLLSTLSLSTYSVLYDIRLNCFLSVIPLKDIFFFFKIVIGTFFFFLKDDLLEAAIFHLSPFPSVISRAFFCSTSIQMLVFSLLSRESDSS